MNHDTGMEENRRILIVEDEEGLAIHLSFLLKRMNYIALNPVASGEQAVERAGDQRPALVLMDISLAGPMDGLEAARLIREKHDIPIIFLSALSSDENIHDAEDSQPYAYLVKPVKEPDLRAAIEIALYRHHMEAYQRESEARLLESEQRYRLLFEKMTNGFAMGEIIFDNAGSPFDFRFLALNPAFEKMSMLDWGGILGRTMREAFPSFDPSDFISIFARVAATGEAVHLEYFLSRAERYINLTIYLVKPGQVAVLTEDISERRQAEDSLRASEAHLRASEAQLRQNTEALQKSEEQLRNSYHRLEHNLRQMNILRNIDQAITTYTDYASMASAILGDLVSPGEIDAAVLFVPNTPGPGRVRGTGPLGVLRMAGLAGLPESTVDSSVMNWQMVMANQVYQNGQPLIINSLRQENHPGAETLHRMAGFNICAVMPLVARRQVKGVLEFYLRQATSENGDWQSFLHSLALQTSIAMDYVEMLENLKRTNRELASAYDETIKGWALALELREKEDRGHAERVSSLSVRLASALGFSGEALDHMRRGAFLHDIGKMAVPDSLLYKAGPLTADEWVTMRQHPAVGYRMLSSIEYLKPALDVVYCHHEKWDGSGYPRGLKGEEIPLSARIFAAIDVWDALTNDRPYRLAWPVEDARAHMKQQAGQHFDPHVVEVFLAIV